MLGQRACEAKSNEITAIPLLLDRLALTGALVTIDAMGCQTKIAQKILDKGAEYLLAIKENWPNLHSEVIRHFDDLPAADTVETTDGEHSRIEVRRHIVSHEVDWLTTDRRFPGEPRFPGLKAIAMVEVEIERNGKTSLERRYYLSSQKLDTRLFAHAVRAHWHIENRLHWVLDVVFHEDLSRLRGARQSPGEELDAGGEDPCGCGVGSPFEVFSEAPIAAQPGESPFHHPTPGQDDEALGGVGSFDDLQGPIAHGGQGGLQLVARVAAIGKDMPQPRERGADRSQYRRSAITVLDIGTMNDGTDQ